MTTMLAVLQPFHSVNELHIKGSNLDITICKKSKWHTGFLPFQDALDDDNNGCLRRQTMATTSATFSQPFDSVNGLLIKGSNF